MVSEQEIDKRRSISEMETTPDQLLQQNDAELPEQRTPTPQAQSTGLLFAIIP